MLNKINQQKTVTNTTEVPKGLELFENWELSEELNDTDLMTAVGGTSLGLGLGLGLQLSIFQVAGETQL